MQDEYYTQLTRFMENGFNIVNRNGTAENSSSDNGLGKMGQFLQTPRRSRASGPVTAVASNSNSKKSVGDNQPTGNMLRPAVVVVAVKFRP